jgi:hypothetical protein
MQYFISGYTRSIYQIIPAIALATLIIPLASMNSSIAIYTMNFWQPATFPGLTTSQSCHYETEGGGFWLTPGSIDQSQSIGCCTGPENARTMVINAHASKVHWRDDRWIEMYIFVEPATLFDSEIDLSHVPKLAIEWTLSPLIQSVPLRVMM